MRLEIPASISAVWGVKVVPDEDPAPRIVWLQNSTSSLRLLALLAAAIKSIAVYAWLEAVGTWIQQLLPLTNHMESGKEPLELWSPDDISQQRPGPCEADRL